MASLPETLWNLPESTSSKGKKEERKTLQKRKDCGRQAISLAVSVLIAHFNRFHSRAICALVIMAIPS